MTDTAMPGSIQWLETKVSEMLAEHEKKCAARLAGMMVASTAFQSQIAALQIDLAAMQKERDQARERGNEWKARHTQAEESILRLLDERETALADAKMYKIAADEHYASLMGVCDKLDAAEKERDAYRKRLDCEFELNTTARREYDAALAIIELNSKRCERDHLMEFQGQGIYECVRCRLDAAVKRAESAERERDEAREMYSQLKGVRTRLQEELILLRGQCDDSVADEQLRIAERDAAFKARDEAEESAVVMRIAIEKCIGEAGAYFDLPAKYLAALEGARRDDAGRALLDRHAAEVRQLREENARLKAESVAMKTGHSEAMNREQAILGRAVAALRQANDENAKALYDSLGAWAGTSLQTEIDAILADSLGTAAGEAWTTMVAALRDHESDCIPFADTCALCNALAKVDARRAGGEGGAR